MTEGEITKRFRTWIYTGGPLRPKNHSEVVGGFNRLIEEAKQEFPDFASDDTSVHGVIISCYRAWFTKWFGDGDEET